MPGKRQGPRIEPWFNEEQGLSKINLDLDYQSMTKATPFSTVDFDIEAFVNTCSLESKILADGPGPRTHAMSTADTPVDTYIEALLLKMLLGERSLCKMKVKGGVDQFIEITMKMKRISLEPYVHGMTLQSAYKRSHDFKEIGVRMFKKYPTHAHNYFSRAYQLLAGFSQQEIEHLDKAQHGIDEQDVISLKRMIRNNVAACLLIEKRFEEVISILDFIDEPDYDKEDPLFEKAVFRRAQALYNLKRCDEVVRCVEMVNYQANPTLHNLHKLAQEELQREKTEFAQMAKRMFNK